mmetsp:Transcript_4593/g.7875  ORF Transcript_4593/g.7875 Transcript_4593/m.7875 type:complete len:150 (-) Transcript_4593:414-863(-)|eukprot:CAMPEP_0119104840 /NCGR_PEP_ID=MMETSP1180-20130426/2948_1 /TAXON_ID=3052 ORGANISM="Chlamydomonas cf sp, Strain CCMP681" /NCGR_SAMPLE_ID=MMETSP1180 /ASSEMBLY_ACC=CAM_ASM_000741 /LENGTH=149 /DNA_ID=CAMNT_0007089695 /DNA_START=252 /DNA_END=701 /DNA_ORIENTATION=-
MSTGRVHCVCLATKTGEVIYERFYDRLSELDKAEARAAFSLASNNVRLVNDQDHVGVFRSAKFTFIPYDDIVVYLLGSGEYEDLGGAEIIRTLISILGDILDKPPSTSVLLDKYMKLALVVDEVINEGIVENTDREAIRKALKNKAAWE